MEHARKEGANGRERVTTFITLGSAAAGKALYTFHFVLWQGDRGRGETARGKMSAYFSLSSSVGRTRVCRHFLSPIAEFHLQTACRGARARFPSPPVMQAQLNRKLILKCGSLVGKKPCLHFANEPSPAACFDVVRHCKRCKSGRPGCYYPCNPPASHAAALSSRMLRARRSKGAAARSPSLRCQITKFGHFLRGHHIYDACTGVCYHQSRR